MLAYLQRSRVCLSVLTIKDSEVLDPVGNLVQDLILAHAVWLIVPAKAYNHEPLFFIHNSLVYVPSCAEVGQDNRTHIEMWRTAGSC